MNRRETILALGALGATPLAALAQQEKRMRRIGFLSGGSLQNTVAWLAAFRESMTALRWVEGHDYVIDARYANGVAEAMKDLAAELVATQPDLLLTPSDEGVHLLAQGTKIIPIVFAIAQDPVGNGLAKTLKRPGGNATGLTSLSRDLSAKRLQLLREAFPRVAHVALLYEPAIIASLSQVKDIEAAAVRLKVRVTPLELRQAADIEPTFKRGAALGAQAYMLVPGHLVFTQRQSIADHVMRAKVPALWSNNEFVEAGGLMAYATSYPDNFRRAAVYVDKILKGAKPGELPIEQPMKFELVINMKTAKATGLTFPQSFLLRADRVIE
jgi:putative ABC transport system substrate-binding protein